MRHFRLNLPLLVLLALAQTSLGVRGASQDRIVTVTKEGTVPVALQDGQLPSKSRETYFLKSAIENPKRTIPLATPFAQQARATRKEPAAPPPQPSPTPPAEVKKAAPAAKKTKPAPVRAQAPEPPPRKPAPITIKKSAPPAPAKGKSQGKPAPVPEEELDEYANVAPIADPIEPVNRGTFWVNHQLYRYLLRPVSKTYEAVLPKQVRSSIHNVFDNSEYPVRLVNNVLQLKFKHADLETRKFVVNTVGGVGGLVRLSDRIPSLANVPPADTGQTLAKWGIGHGPYTVLPVLGPKSTRDIVGLAGDTALSPVTWIGFGGVGAATALAVSSSNSIRNLNGRLKAYDATTENTLDPYLAVRSAYSQHRKKAASD